MDVISGQPCAVGTSGPDRAPDRRLPRADSGSTPPKVWWRNNRLARRPATDAAPATRAAAGKGDALLHRHLAALARERHCLASAYLLHTPKAIRQDECGVAVPAEAVADDDREYVAFFYTDTAAFERERAVMAAPEWSEFTVALRAAYPAAGGEPCYAHGAQLPPVVVLEDGESMREWAVGSGSDAVMAVNTLVQVRMTAAVTYAKSLTAVAVARNQTYVCGCVPLSVGHGVRCAAHAHS